MNKVLFKSKEEHWAWAWTQYISLYGKINEDGDWEESSIWEEEDLPKLKPFFDWDKDRDRNLVTNMPPEVKESFDYYMTVQEAAGDKRDRKDLCGEIEQTKLVEILGFEPFPEDEDNDCIHDHRYSIDNVPEISDYYEISYPCVMVYHLETVWDRIGTSVLAFVEFVSLEEFSTKSIIEYLAELQYQQHNKK
jgi:hypothetical protein